MKIIKLTDKDTKILDKICEWNYEWWGKRDNETKEEVKSYMQHCLCENRIPQTFVALENDEPVGMYQFTMADDLNSRPDIYPWLVNVYVDKKYRGQGICKELMSTVLENARKLDINEIYLYTKHKGLYEKYGWEFIEEVETFRVESPIERLYVLKIK